MPATSYQKFVWNVCYFILKCLVCVNKYYVWLSLALNFTLFSTWYFLLLLIDNYYFNLNNYYKSHSDLNLIFSFRVKKLKQIKFTCWGHSAGRVSSGSLDMSSRNSGPLFKFCLSFVVVNFSMINYSVKKLLGKIGLISSNNLKIAIHPVVEVTFHGTYVEVLGKLPFTSQCGFWGSNSVNQTYWQVPYLLTHLPGLVLGIFNQ